VLCYNCYNNGIEVYKEGREKGYFFSVKDSGAVGLASFWVLVGRCGVIGGTYSTTRTRIACVIPAIDSHDCLRANIPDTRSRRYVDQSPKTLCRIIKNSPGFHAKVMKRHNRLKALIEQRTVSLILFQLFEKDRFSEKREYTYISQIGAVALFGICFGFLLGGAA
jgi:hypothetical protein